MSAWLTEQRLIQSCTLLQQIIGDSSKLEGLELDTFIFLLIRKV